MTTLVLYKTLHYFVPKLASFCVYSSRNIISTKTLFSTQGKYYKFHYEIQNAKTLFSTQGKYYKFQYEIQNPKHYFQLEEITSQCKYEIQNPKTLFSTQGKYCKF